MKSTFDYEWQRLGLRFEQLSQHLDRLDRAALPHVTDYFASVATLLRRKRREIDKRERQMRAARAAAPPHPSYPDSPNGRRRRREAERAARAIEIMRLAARGWESATIGRRYGISAGTVSRIHSSSTAPNSESTATMTRTFAVVTPGSRSNKTTTIAALGLVLALAGCCRELGHRSVEIENPPTLPADCADQLTRGGNCAVAVPPAVPAFEPVPPFIRR